MRETKGRDPTQAGVLARRRVLRLAGAVTAGFILPVRPGLAADAAPAATIERFYAVLLVVMKAAKLLSFDQRYQRLKPAISRTFDLALMTRIAVGPDWVRLSASQQHRLIASFTRYTIATYANRFNGYSGEHFAVDPKPLANPNGTIVATRLIRTDDKPIALNYLMRQQASGPWQVIDVYLSGTISELAARRSEFVSILRKKGASGLVRLLDKRSAALRTG